MSSIVIAQEKSTTNQLRLISQIFDSVIATTLILMLSPVLALLALYCLLTQGRITIRSTVWGESGSQQVYRFAFSTTKMSDLLRHYKLQYLPNLFLVALGRMRLAGPAAESIRRPSTVKARIGFISSVWIRTQMNCLFDTREQCQLQDAASWSPVFTLKMLLKAGLAYSFGGRAPTSRETIELFGLKIHNYSMATAISRLVDHVERGERAHVAFLNADCVNKAARNESYRSALKSVDYLLADGSGLQIASSMAGTPIRENVNGTDLFPRLLKELPANTPVFLLGGRPGVADGVADWVAANHDHIDICGTQHGYFDKSEEQQVIERIRESGAKVLLIAFGAPKQERWLLENLAETGATLGLAVGGLFDFYSGRIPRAPLWLREIGAEWTYRLWQEPRRMWQRYLIGNVVFLARAYLQHGIRSSRVRS